MVEQERRWRLMLFRRLRLTSCRSRLLLLLRCKGRGQRRERCRVAGQQKLICRHRQLLLLLVLLEAALRSCGLSVTAGGRRRAPMVMVVLRVAKVTPRAGCVFRGPHSGCWPEGGELWCGKGRSGHSLIPLLLMRCRDHCLMVL